MYFLEVLDTIKSGCEAIGALEQGPATHGITGATSGGSGAAKYHFISFFLNFMTIKIFF